MKTAFTFLFATLTMVLVGCGQPECDGVDCGHDHSQVEHVHPTLGPHQGRLVELGAEEYHAEVVHDEATELVTVYLLDATALNAVGTDATEAKINLVHEGAAEQFALKASPQLFDAPGETSRFVSDNEEVGHELEHAHGSVQLVIAIRGKQYRGSIEGTDHEHEHEHEHEMGQQPTVVK